MTQNKREYLVPETEVIEMWIERTICTSVNANMDGPWGPEENI